MSSKDPAAIPPARTSSDTASASGAALTGPRAYALPRSRREEPCAWVRSRRSFGLTRIEGVRVVEVIDSFAGRKRPLVTAEDEEDRDHQRPGETIGEPSFS